MALAATGILVSGTTLMVGKQGYDFAKKAPEGTDLNATRDLGTGVGFGILSGGLFGIGAGLSMYEGSLAKSLGGGFKAASGAAAGVSLLLLAIGAGTWLGSRD